MFESFLFLLPLVYFFPALGFLPLGLPLYAAPFTPFLLGLGFQQDSSLDMALPLGLPLAATFLLSSTGAMVQVLSARLCSVVCGGLGGRRETNLADAGAATPSWIWRDTPRAPNMRSIEGSALFGSMIDNKKSYQVHLSWRVWLAKVPIN